MNNLDQSKHQANNYQMEQTEKQSKAYSIDESLEQVADYPKKLDMIGFTVI